MGYAADSGEGRGGGGDVRRGVLRCESFGRSDGSDCNIYRAGKEIFEEMSIPERLGSAVDSLQSGPSQDLDDSPSVFPFYGPVS